MLSRVVGVCYAVFMVRSAVLFWVPAVVLVLVAGRVMASQVHNRPSSETLAQAFARSEHVVVARPVGKSVTVRTVVLPKETHHQRAHETTYSDVAELYTVVQVLRSDRLKAGATVKVYEQPAYDLYLVRRYHEEGVSKSVIVEEYQPRHAVEPGKNVILLLSVWGEVKGVYQKNAVEGAASLNDVKALLAAVPPAPPAQPGPPEPPSVVPPRGNERE